MPSVLSRPLYKYNETRTLHAHTLRNGERPSLAAAPERDLVVCPPVGRDLELVPHAVTQPVLDLGGVQAASPPYSLHLRSLPSRSRLHRRRCCCERGRARPPPARRARRPAEERGGRRGEAPRSTAAPQKQHDHQAGSACSPHFSGRSTHRCNNCPLFFLPLEPLPFGRRCRNQQRVCCEGSFSVSR